MQMRRFIIGTAAVTAAAGGVLSATLALAPAQPVPAQPAAAPRAAVPASIIGDGQRR